MSILIRRSLLKKVQSLSQREKLLVYTFCKYLSVSKGRPLFGRKKIRKLVFLIDYLDSQTGEITGRERVFNYRFIIWFYGPFSEELYYDLENVIDKGLVVEDIVSEVAQLRVKVDGEEITLSMYDDEGFNKVIYIYKPVKENLKFVTKVLDILREAIGSEYKSKLSKIDKIVEMYWQYTPNEIEKLVNNMLHLDISKKYELLGMQIDEYLAKYK